MSAASVPVITIPAPADASAADWRNAPLQRRHLADRTRMSDIAGTAAETQAFGEDGFGLDDIVDILNPLQHIPFVNTLYRELTGDQSSQVAGIAGSALLGGPLGLMAAVFNAIFATETGNGALQTAALSLTGSAATPQAAREIHHGAQPQPSMAHSPTPSPEHIHAAALHQKASKAYAQLAGGMPSRIDILPPEAAMNLHSTAARHASHTGSADDALLDLYGQSDTPAHKAYRQANMLGYLQAASSHGTAQLATINRVM